jgi:hypothetical protein
MFQHFGNRLKRDIKQIVDRRLEASAVASGSAMRVCAKTRQVTVRSSDFIRSSLRASTSKSSPTNVSATPCGTVARSSPRFRTSTPRATPRRSTTRSDRASAGGIRSSVARHSGGREKSSYVREEKAYVNTARLITHCFTNGKPATLSAVARSVMTQKDNHSHAVACIGICRRGLPSFSHLGQER